MYLGRVRAKGFKSLLDTDVSLRQGVTVVLGENNAGKSNFIDALRLLTDPLDGRRSRWWEAEDVHPWAESGAELTAVYGGLTPAETGTHLQALVPAAEGPGLPDGHRVRYTVQFTRPAADARPQRPVWSAGRLLDDPEPEARRAIRHVYLPPMRNAQQELASSAGNRLRLILAAELGAEDAIKDFEREQADHFRSLEGHEKIEAARKRINDPLGLLTAGAHPQHMGLSFADPTLVSIARALRTRMSDEGLAVEDISRSGLGYANLLYIATVLAELEAARDADLTLFLVEEPEAHLHPQLQILLLDHLRAQALRSQHAPPPDGGAPLGRIQVVITTHSPVLAAATTVEDLVVLKRCRTLTHTTPATAPAEADRATTTASADADTEAEEKPAGFAFTTAAISVAKIPFAKHEAAKLDRYLDITKSAMLFGTRVILVEGLAEALLMPAFAELVLSALPPEEQPRAKAVFRGTCIVAVDGVDFKPYMRALLSGVGGIRIADRVVLITDQDPRKKKTPPEQDDRDQPDAETASTHAAGTTGTVSEPAADSTGSDEEPEVGFNRALYLHDSLRAWDVPDAAFHIAESKPTLEPELMRPETNQTVLAETFFDLRPRSQHRWKPIEEATTSGERAAAFGALFTSEIGLPKGDFAYRLADRLTRKPGGFTVPEHLAGAIRWIAGVDEATA
ncbi:AAA family ATPase [Streptomyces sp. NBC_01210]|uniref:ATP-dependent nuclease n=1 Tax=Streptomyces sp. NBC_01210 TaxID=2903774 RepID=UPI002E0E4CB4|nr:AAA family ATPase [Streptomyces sp. NBC_01210]WSR03788.1 AAA family ATPase [Streptomyces sp. NBC_01210]